MAQQDILRHPIMARAVAITRRAEEARRKYNLPDNRPITREALIKAGVVKPEPAAPKPAAPTSSGKGPFGGLLGNFGASKAEPTKPAAPAAPAKPSTDSGDAA